ncbi:hypothetical protein GobsT_27670 [Gemmata obscuriglobus]|uniref:Uncharacterized protein n=1 Tax=Gemmata obscuriglobus TaxID=114 RepID=A0A2Z3H2A3_9BACT|nr:hypothetical protein [Gemmata obscuriglobus]AWM38981.1 hypothetical protein C1280_19650 [Gemmata obscuriglobus]QEG27999.1 hypothetical protein GobsT_27670 [Gemmata obscuriglobus]VTS05524.1 Uncharacterized protein OS=[Clostridium] hathewayi 12489931 GN=HMPREF1093_05501 PE=4 SV=1 [Gemmata obscuriglobus UQM 2246]
MAQSIGAVNSNRSQVVERLRTVLTHHEGQMRNTIACVLIACAGCGPNRPESTDTLSESLPSLAERSAFLERYVTFRRSYRELGFHVRYQNNGNGLVPGPSDWDIRVVATVPREELGAWVPDGVSATPTTDTHWLNGVPGGEHARQVSEWYVGQRVVVGIDRARAVVAYRTWKW